MIDGVWVVWLYTKNGEGGEFLCQRNTASQESEGGGILGTSWMIMGWGRSGLGKGAI